MEHRKIIHIDMDCFYAAIEMRDHPELINQPIAVGGAADRRGVLCTCNYLARKFGVHSAMATSQALRLCPELVLLPVDMPKYSTVSKEIRKIFANYTDLIEPLSLDEAFLDVTECTDFQNSATRIAQAIRAQIWQEHQLTASAGIAPNKFLAKIASDWNKPNGQYVINPENIAGFVQELSVKKIFGVGKVTAKKLADLNILSCTDLQQWSQADLTDHFGKFGNQLYYLSRGIDPRPVNPYRVRKSVSIEHTYAKDLVNFEECLTKLPELKQDFLKRIKPYETKIKSLFVKIKFADFKSTTVEQTNKIISDTLWLELLRTGWQRQQKPVRLLGIGAHLAETEEIVQENLF